MEISSINPYGFYGFCVENNGTPNNIDVDGCMQQSGFDETRNKQIVNNLKRQEYHEKHKFDENIIQLYLEGMKSDKYKYEVTRNMNYAPEYLLSDEEYETLIVLFEKSMRHIYMTPDERKEFSRLTSKVWAIARFKYILNQQK